MEVTIAARAFERGIVRLLMKLDAVIANRVRFRSIACDARLRMHCPQDVQPDDERMFGQAVATARAAA